MEVTFREMKKKDIPEVVALCNEVFEEETSLEYAMKTYKKQRRDPNSIYIVGIAEGKIVSHLKITVIHTIYENMNTYSILNHVGVKKEYRRHGIATKMLDVAFRISKEHGCKKVELWSNNVRTAAHACYYNYGFALDEAGFFSMSVK